MNIEPITILLVEDEPAHAEIVRRNLERAREINRLIHVADGQAALDYLKRCGAYSNPSEAPRPHLILLDLRLPRVDGLEVLKVVKNDPELKSITVVILTTSAAETDIARAYETNANSYLVKPVDFEKFVTLMDTFGWYWLMLNKYPH